MSTTANVCAVQFKPPYTKTGNSRKSFVLSGGMGQFAGCAHEAGTTAPQMENRSEFWVYRLTLRRASKLNKHFARANNGFVWQLKPERCTHLSGTSPPTGWCDQWNMPTSSCRRAAALNPSTVRGQNPSRRSQKIYCYNCWTLAGKSDW